MTKEEKLQKAAENIYPFTNYIFEDVKRQNDREGFILSVISLPASEYWKEVFEQESKHGAIATESELQSEKRINAN